MGGHCWTSLLVTAVVVVLPLFRPLEVGETAVLVVSLVLVGAEVMRKVIAVVGFLRHQKGLADFCYGIPEAPELGFVPRHMRLPPWLRPFAE